MRLDGVPHQTMVDVEAAGQVGDGLDHVDLSGAILRLGVGLGRGLGVGIRHQDRGQARLEH